MPGQIPTVEVLIAAQGIYSLEQLPRVAKQLLDANCSAVMVNQCDSESSLQSPSDDLRIFHYAETGISRSRNKALSHARGDIFLITDDDVELLDGFDRTLEEAFRKYEDADIITFQSVNEQGRMRKSYSAAPHWHSIKTLMRVSSIEIALRRKSFDGHTLPFDERFGLGASWPTGEETVFLSDALQQGRKILYVPRPIVRHADLSSGRSLHGNASVITAKGAMLYRIFGWKAYGISLLFALKKRRETGFSLARTIRLMYAGIEDFKSMDHGS